MIGKKGVIILLGVLVCAISCDEFVENGRKKGIEMEEKIEQEKAAILQVLNDETKAAFNRDYEGWKDKWIHEDFVSKTYMQLTDSSMTETLGWDEIDDFVRTYIEEHPEPAPLPSTVSDINVRLYGTGAWVNYEQNDPERGLKRETRLMEKLNGEWKIAGMHTTIYGFGK